MQGKFDRINLFNALYKHCDKDVGKIEIRYLPSRKQIFCPIREIGPNEFDEEENIYFGCATRDGKGGTKANIVEIAFLWCDIDFKDIPQAEVDKRLSEFPFPPTFSIPILE